jgi:hypothetical protein
MSEAATSVNWMPPFRRRRHQLGGAPGGWQYGAA